jgi:GxxExxY protein
MAELLYKDECYTIQNAVFAVYKEIGSGFLEAVYQECLENELRERSVPFERQQEIRLYYKSKLIEQTYRADIVCYEKIILELKAVTEIIPAHKSQLLNYLKMSKLELGLLVNFGHYPDVEIVRIVNTKRF